MPHQINSFNQKSVAINVIKSSLKGSKESVFKPSSESIRNEIDILRYVISKFLFYCPKLIVLFYFRQLQHPNIVEYIGICKDPSICIITRLCKRDLNDHIKSTMTNPSFR